MAKRFIILENGKVFEGTAFGADTGAVGELVFNTAAGGYMETLTDQRYFGQIVLMTFPSLGNYGAIESDMKGCPRLAGVIVREIAEAPSNFRSELTIDQFLKKHEIPGVCGVDTREIMRILREEGVMNAFLCDHVPEDLSLLKSYGVKNALEHTVRFEVKSFAAENAVCDIAVMDLGCEAEVVPELVKRGCSVTVYPCDAGAEPVLSGGHDGVVLTGGAGDPAEMSENVEEIKKLMDSDMPVFAIGLGHQLLALAHGAKIIKMKNGHRGSNIPVKDVFGDRVYITRQNHGYVVDAEGIDAMTVSYINANDGTCEGLDYENGSFSVQFLPLPCASPNDTSFFYDRLIYVFGGDE